MVSAEVIASTFCMARSDAFCSQIGFLVGG